MANNKDVSEKTTGEQSGGYWFPEGYQCNPGLIGNLIYTAIYTTSEIDVLNFSGSLELGMGKQIGKAVQGAASLDTNLRDSLRDVYISMFLKAGKSN